MFQQAYIMLPSISFYWTGILLCFGLAHILIFDNMINFADKYKDGHRKTDFYNIIFCICIISIFALYLSVPSVQIIISDSIIILNIFFTSHIVLQSITVLRYFSSKAAYLRSN